LSIPTGGRGFSVYEDMRDKLIARGIPAFEISSSRTTTATPPSCNCSAMCGPARSAFSLAARRKWAPGQCPGTPDCLHHLDAPWRPADVEQREGRILRQGNTNAEVQIYRYVTEQSFDAYMWQTLETKARFIGQVMTGESDLRRIEDIDGTALTYAEVKAIASGNPMVIEKPGLTPNRPP
jgi:hypothetical protein